MSDSSHNSVSKSTSDAMPSSASSTTLKPVSDAQDLNLNHLSLNSTPHSHLSNGGLKYETSTFSPQDARSQSPMDVDGMGNSSNLTGNPHYSERNDGHNSVQDLVEMFCSFSTPTPAIDKLPGNGCNEGTNGNLWKIKTFPQTTQIQSTLFTTSKTNNENALSSSLPDNCEMNNGNKFDGKHCNILVNKNLTATDISGTSFGNRDTNKPKITDSDQYVASKYKSSSISSSISHRYTNLTSTLDNVNHSLKDEEQLLHKPRPVKDVENKDVSPIHSLSSTSLDCPVSSQPSHGINSSLLSIEPSQTPSFDYRISGKLSQALMQSESSENIGAGSALATSSKHEARQLKFRENPLNDLEKALALHSKEHFATTTPSTDAQADCSICLSDVNEESPYQSDEDAARDLVGCVKLRECNHCFHTSCLLKTLTADSNSICCPNCKTIHGTMTGIQPKGGSMKVRVNQYSLPGYHGTNTIAITYSFPRGIQGPEHPTPGRAYYLIGFPRTAYLPDTPQGRKVLRLLREAFKRRLVFTVGTSATLNQPDCVIWNGIHHKTETTNSGGHGYPDPKYLDNVTMELAAVGVTEDNCTSTSELGEETTADDLSYSSRNYGGTSGLSTYGGLGISSTSHGGASGSSANNGGASGSSANHGGASRLSLSHGGVSGSPTSHGGASRSSLSHGGVSGSSASHGGASGLSLSHVGASGSSLSNCGASGSMSLGFASGSSSYQGGTCDGTIKSSGSTSTSGGLFEGVRSKLSGMTKSFSSVGVSSSSSQRHSGDRQSLLHIKFRSNPKNGGEKLLANISAEVPTPSSFDTICPVCCQPLGADAPSQTRKLADRDIVGAVMLNNCGHSFHCCCLYSLLYGQRIFFCPVCNCVHGTVKGTQPTNGKIECTTENRSLSGHEDYGTIVIKYFIYKGHQGREHPNPGAPYQVIGFPRTAYLPDSAKGRLVRLLLKKAFDMRLIFTVGYSEAFKSHDCVTWGRISHKTRRSGGGQFGYPDPNYLDNVLMELAALGVTERS